MNPLTPKQQEALDQLTKGKRVYSSELDCYHIIRFKALVTKGYAVRIFERDQCIYWELK